MGIYRKLNRITFGDLKHPKDASDFLKAIFFGGKAGFVDFLLDFYNTNVAFPNASVPIAGIIDYHRQNGVTFEAINEASIIGSINLIDPIIIQTENDLSRINPLNKIFKYSDSDHVFWLVNSFLEELERSDTFEKGVFEGLEWCLNEVIDNVIQHAGTEHGFVMGQIHKSSKHIAFTIFDSGIGIFNSLKDTAHNPRHPVDALTLALQEGVTRDKKIGQGNGMFGLKRIIENNQGRLTLTSNSASLFIEGNQTQTFTKIPTISRERGCTIVDFQIDYNSEISLGDALKFNGKSYEPVNIKIEQLENSSGEIHFKLVDQASGFGTRQAGERIRHKILNIHRQCDQIIIIDFAGIDLISSSFADELLGKLVIEFGFFGFNNLIKLKNMNSLIQNIVQRSVSQRMAESLEE